MKKSVFKQFLQMIKSRKISFSRIADQPSGNKLRRRASGEKRRGCDGTMRS